MLIVLKSKLMPTPILSPANRSTYLRHDLTKLGVIVLVVAVLVSVLWYVEQRSGGFSSAARGLLDFFTK